MSDLLFAVKLVEIRGFGLELLPKFYLTFIGMPAEGELGVLMEYDLSMKCMLSKYKITRTENCLPLVNND